MSPEEKAYHWLQDDAVVFDTETTGIDENAEIIEISIIARDGGVILDTLIKPVNPISAESTAIHGITNEDVANAPSFSEVYPEIKAALTDRKVIAYNSAFDVRMLEQDCERHNLEVFEVDHACAMLAYAEFWGQPSSRKGFKWQKLGAAAAQQGIEIGEVHRALADSCLTLAIVEKMAEKYELKKENSAGVSP